jgi:hypothetical protein
MKKQIITLAFILTSVLFTQAQTYLGFIGGVNRSAILSTEELYGIRPTSGKSFGVSLDTYISEIAYLNFSLLLEDKGYFNDLGELSFDEYGVNELRYSYKYLTLPVLIKVQGKGRLFVSGGVGTYISVLYKVRVQHYAYGYEVYDGIPIENPSSSIDAGIMTQFGLGYRVSENIQIKSHFHMAVGLSSFKNKEDFSQQDPTVSNLSVNASLGVFVRLNKSEQESK